MSGTGDGVAALAARDGGQRSKGSLGMNTLVSQFPQVTIFIMKLYRPSQPPVYHNRFIRPTSSCVERAERFRGGCHAEFVGLCQEETSLATLNSDLP